MKRAVPRCSRRAPLWAASVLALFFAAGVWAEEGRTVTVIPRLVYVGDGARLIMDLDPRFAEIRGMVIDDTRLLPATEAVTVSRVELENRQGRSRLLVDFIAWAPGRHEIPPIRIGALVFPGLEVEIASILDTETARAGALPAGTTGNNRVLSPPAEPLAAPGTMLLVYAAVALIVLGIMLAAAGRKNFPLLRRWFLAWRRRRAFRRMETLFRRLGETLEQDAGGTLEQMNRELRRFLTFLTGENCAAMVPGEFTRLPGTDDDFGGPWLCRFFRRADALRFRGGDIPRGEAADVLEAARLFLASSPLRGENSPPREGGAA
jgi:hypothetical protein